MSNQTWMTDASPFWIFLSKHPAWPDNIDWVGDWDPSCSDVMLDGNFTAAQLRALADYMENNS
jgi:hypothetical protein